MPVLRVLLTLTGLLSAWTSEVAHYKFWENYAQGFKDYSGNGRTAVSGLSETSTINDVHPTARGIYMNSNDRVTLPPNDLVSSGFLLWPQFAMTAWVRPFNTYMVMLERRTVSDGLVVRWRLQVVNGVNVMRLRVHDVITPDCCADGTIEIPINQWVFLTVSVDYTPSPGCHATGYNGLTQVLNANAAACTTPLISDSNTIGTAWSYEGLIYEFVIYDSLLAASDIAGMLEPAGTGSCPAACGSPCALEPYVQCLSPCASIYVTLDCSTTCNCGSIGCEGNDPNACMKCNNSCISNMCYGRSYTQCILGQACDATCATCSDSGPEFCLTCLPGAALTNTDPSYCQCVAGYFGDASVCQSCPSVCAACLNGANNSCTSCKPGASLTGPAPNLCECSAGFYPAPDARNCVQCTGICAQCSSASFCLSCVANAYLPTAGICKCVSGFFESAGVCMQCMALCSVCPSVVACTTCTQHGELDAQGNCKCSAGYFPSNNQCSTCSVFCDVCASSSVCTQCHYPALLLNATCVQECPPDYRPSGVECEYFPDYPPTPFLSAFPNNTLAVSFSKPITKAFVNESDISVFVQDSDLQEYPASWTVTQTQPHTSFQIDLLYLNDRPTNISQATVQFVHPAEFMDDQGKAINQTTLNVTLFPYPKSPRPYVGAYLNTTIAQATAQAVQSGMAAVAVISVLTGSFGSLWTMFSQLQLLSYLPLSTIPIPTDFAAALQAMNVNSFISNPFTGVFNASDPAFSSPDFAYNYGFSSTVFLLNSGIMAAAAVLTLISIVPVWLLSKVKVPIIALYFSKLVPRFRWGVFIRYWIQVYLDVGLTAILQFYTFPSDIFSSVTAAVNCIISGVVILAFAGTPFALIYFTLLHRHEMRSHHDPEFNAKWEELYKDFKPGKPLAVAFYIVFFARRAVLALTLMLLPDREGVQGIMICCVAVMVRGMQTWVYFLSARLYSSCLDQANVLATETCIAVVSVLVSSFAIDLSSSVASSICNVGTVFLLSTVALNTVFSVLKTAEAICVLLKEYRKAVSKAAPRWLML